MQGVELVGVEVSRRELHRAPCICGNGWFIVDETSYFHDNAWSQDGSEWSVRIECSRCLKTHELREHVRYGRRELRLISKKEIESVRAAEVKRQKRAREAEKSLAEFASSPTFSAALSTRVEQMRQGSKLKTGTLVYRELESTLPERWTEAKFRNLVRDEGLQGALLAERALVPVFLKWLGFEHEQAEAELEALRAAKVHVPEPEGEMIWKDF